MAEPSGWGEESVITVIIATVVTAIGQSFAWLKARARLRQEQEESESDDSTEVEIARMASADSAQNRLSTYLEGQLAQARVDLTQVTLERNHLQARNIALARTNAVLELNTDILKSSIMASGSTMPRLIAVPPMDDLKDPAD